MFECVFVCVATLHIFFSALLKNYFINGQGIGQDLNRGLAYMLALLATHSYLYWWKILSIILKRAVVHALSSLLRKKPNTPVKHTDTEHRGSLGRVVQGEGVHYFRTVDSCGANTRKHTEEF